MNDTIFFDIWSLQKLFFLFFPLIFLYLTSLQITKTIFKKSALFLLFNSKFEPNKYSLPQN